MKRISSLFLVGSLMVVLVWSGSLVGTEASAAETKVMNGFGGGPTVLVEADNLHLSAVSPNEEAVEADTADTTREWQVGWGARLQYQTYGTYSKEQDPEVGLGAQLRRLRIKISGMLPAYNVGVVMQPSLDGGEAGLELGYIEWNPWESTALIGGQFKVPATRQFMVSSGRLQMVDRSFVDAEHRLLYDIGLMVRQQIHLGKSARAQVYGAVTTGEGRQRASDGQGYSYTLRAEYLPFGFFDQYRISDVEQADRWRLSVGGAVNVNYDAVHTRGNFGEYMRGFRSDIGTLYGDLLLKRSGWSLFSQLSYRDADPSNNQPNLGGAYFINEGTGFLVQSGLMVSDVMEVSGRYATYEPSDRVGWRIASESRYSVGLTRYFRSDRLKVQADAGWIHREDGTLTENDLLIRAQVQVDF